MSRTDDELERAIEAIPELREVRKHYRARTGPDPELRDMAPPTAAPEPGRVVLVLEYALDPDADPDTVQRVVHDYVRRLQDVPMYAPMTPPVIHAAIDESARRVLAVFDR